MDSPRELLGSRQYRIREREEREMGKIESERVHILRFEIGQMEAMKQLLLSTIGPY